ncbi:hypothetical protein ACJEDT_14090 [Rhodococcoides fascians]|uniref:hypothetical protein n=1 Tax=Nocardiaceae TaxID=85025 RepID=UPI001E524A6A|nr:MULTISPECIES: hypothetical protein [Rhodococcus]MDJ0409738.1 hypothetical protein [Rhodococcus fascians]MDQ0279853.1 hypothetical protein [Rhodococcus fascians]
MTAVPSVHGAVTLPSFLTVTSKNAPRPVPVTATEYEKFVDPTLRTVNAPEVIEPGNNPVSGADAYVTGSFELLMVMSTVPVVN